MSSAGETWGGSRALSQLDCSDENLGGGVGASDELDDDRHSKVAASLPADDTLSESASGRSTGAGVVGPKPESRCALVAQ